MYKELAFFDEYNKYKCTLLDYAVGFLGIQTEDDEFNYFFAGSEGYVFPDISGMVRADDVGKGLLNKKRGKLKMELVSTWLKVYQLDSQWDYVKKNLKQEINNCGYKFQASYTSQPGCEYLVDPKTNAFTSIKAKSFKI